MKISNKIVSKFQEGGAAPAPEAPAPQGPPAGAPAGPEAGGQDPIAQIAEVASQALQNQDCEAALAVCEAFVGLLSGGGPEGGAPAGPEAGAPVYRKGGRLLKRVK